MFMSADVPGRPSRPAVSQVAGRQMVVIWEAPHFEENRPILCYNVDYKAKGESWQSFSPLVAFCCFAFLPFTSDRLLIDVLRIKTTFLPFTSDRLLVDVLIRLHFYPLPVTDY